MTPAMVAASVPAREHVVRRRVRQSATLLERDLRRQLRDEKAKRRAAEAEVLRLARPFLLRILGARR